MAQKRNWDLQHQRKRLDYLFRAYVRAGGEGWHIRRGLLEKLLRDCGEHYAWSETVVVGPAREWQQWNIFGFKEYEQKLKFEAGVPAVMAVEIEPAPGIPLPNGFADPNRDQRELERRAAREARDLR